MSKRPPSRKPARVHISAERAGRLYRILCQLTNKPTRRAVLLKKLDVGQRTFYRDVEMLRACGIVINTNVNSDGYSLPGTLADALHRLPFPDPELTFGDIEALMKGRKPTHDKLRKLFRKVTRTSR
jgi:biotin operon repressor